MALAGCLDGLFVLVMVVELLNTGIESAIDRIGPEWHELAKRAKDIGSAAVMLCLIFTVLVWAVVLPMALLLLSLTLLNRSSRTSEIAAVPTGEH